MASFPPSGLGGSFWLFLLSLCWVFLVGVAVGFCCVFFFVWVFCILYLVSLWRAFGAVCVLGPWVGRGDAWAGGVCRGGGDAVARGV